MQGLHSPARLAPRGLALLLLSCLTSHALSACNHCTSHIYEPVCTGAGVTVASACLAECQGLHVVSSGNCIAGDALHDRLRTPPAAALLARLGGQRQQRRSAAEAQQGAEAAARAGRDPSSIDDVVLRYAADGFVYVGHAARSDDGAGWDTPHGSQGGGSGGLPEGVTQVKLRGVRVEIDGAVYLEASPRDVDLTQLPTEGATPTQMGPPGASSQGDEEQADRQQRRLQQQQHSSSGRWLDADPGFGSADEDWPGFGPGSGSGRQLLQDDRYRSDVYAWPNRIVGLLQAGIVLSQYNAYCTGTWVSPYDVITAAHCVYNHKEGELKDFVFWPGKYGPIETYGKYRYSRLWYFRYEYPLIAAGGIVVNYFDMAMLRMTQRSDSWMGIKYSCTKTDFPKTQTCGYPADKWIPPSPLMEYPYCDNCYYTSNACVPMVQPVTWCHSASGQSGSSVWDLTDYRILGVLSGGWTQGPWYRESTIWTPIDALHFFAFAPSMWDQVRDAVPPPPMQRLPPAPAGRAPVALPRRPPPPKSRKCTTEGAVQLAAGILPGEGRLELCHDGEWGSVCYDGFDVAEANVVCRQLNWKYGQQVPAWFGPSDLDQAMWLSELNCFGNETSLLECAPASNGTWLAPFCTRTQAIGVKCYNQTLGAGGYFTNGGRQSFLPAPGYTCTAGDENKLRLVQGTGNGSASGRVEVCKYGFWGSVCDDGWDDRDAAVVCKSFGYAYGVATLGALHGGPTMPGPQASNVWLDEVECSGLEATLPECRASPWGRSDCSHRQDAGVVCSNEPLPPSVKPFRRPCVDAGALRIMDGPVAEAGRLEVCDGRNWGAVCGAGWDNVSSTVACRQLGYTYGEAFVTTPVEDQPVVMSEVFCNRTNFDLWIPMGPNRLTQCQFWGMATVFCEQPSQVAGVHCYASAPPAPPPFRPWESACEVEGALRLMANDTANATTTFNGTAPYNASISSGRLEICHDNIWGTICDDAFSVDSASVACRQLGWDAGTLVPKADVPGVQYTYYNRPIWLDQVKCRGTEKQLVDCKKSDWLRSNCFHAGDVGVKCYNNTPLDMSPTCGKDGDMMLYAGNTTSNGVPLVCYKHKWGSICDRLFNNSDAAVVCRTLGFAWGVRLPTDTFRPAPGELPIWISDLVCRGTEPSLLRCRTDWLERGPPPCTHLIDAQVQCYDMAPPSPPSPTPPLPPLPPNYICGEEGALRLRDWPGEEKQGRGHIEVCWDIARGGGKQKKLRWSTICDDSFGAPEANVACRQLGFAWGEVLRRRTFPIGADDQEQVMDDVSCTGSEDKLVQCTFNSRIINCVHWEDVGVQCYGIKEAAPPTPPTPVFGGPTPPPPANLSAIACSAAEEFNVRLVGGNSSMLGRVEVCHNGLYGTICDDDFSNQEASAVCRQLGFVRGEAWSVEEFSDERFPPGDLGQPIWLDELICTGNETALANCTYVPPWGVNNCQHVEDVGVRCFGPEPPPGTPFPPPSPSPAPPPMPPLLPLEDPTCKQEGDVRLVGAAPGQPTPRGRLEFCYSRKWGTVCDDGFTDREAAVVCRQLGATGGRAVPGRWREAFGAGPTPQPIWFDGVSCSGGEVALPGCRLPPAGQGIDCTHAEDVTVICGESGPWPAAPPAAAAPDPSLACPIEGAVRLVAGRTSLEGRLEVCVAGWWSTVCSASMGNEVARVVCRQLGLQGGLVVPGGIPRATIEVPPGSAALGQPIAIGQVDCLGDEQQLMECRTVPWQPQYCSHNQDAGVLCS